MKYRFRTAKSFRRALAKLSESQKKSAKEAFRIFRENPFDPRLRTHKIHKLTAAYGKTIYSVCIEGDLRAVFFLEGDTVWSVDIGSHAIYRA
jgi:mRNA-degrading endonuclease YafQ of YafQ-DinJ toxin-antitoxin module